MKFTAAAPSCQQEQPAREQADSSRKGMRDKGMPIQVDGGDVSTAPLLSRAAGPSALLHSLTLTPTPPPRSMPQAHPQPRGSRFTTAPTRGPSPIARQLPRPRSSGRHRNRTRLRLPQPSPSITNLPPSHSLPAPQAGTAPPPRMLGAVVRAPEGRLAAGRIRTTAPKSLRGGKAVDGHPQRRPCPRWCRGCPGGKRRRDPLRGRGRAGAVPAPEGAPQLQVPPGCSRWCPLQRSLGAASLCCWGEAADFSVLYLRLLTAF